MAIRHRHGGNQDQQGHSDHHDREPGKYRPDRGDQTDNADTLKPLTATPLQDRPAPSLTGYGFGVVKHHELATGGPVGQQHQAQARIGEDGKRGVTEQ
jgi:hypothetical protein